VRGNSVQKVPESLPANVDLECTDGQPDDVRVSAGATLDGPRSTELRRAMRNETRD
jgi:hypothetical protein